MADDKQTAGKSMAIARLCLRCDDLFGVCKPLAGQSCKLDHAPRPQIQPEPLAAAPDESFPWPAGQSIAERAAWIGSLKPGDELPIPRPPRQMAVATAVQIADAAPPERVVVFVKRMATAEQDMSTLRREVAKPVKTIIVRDDADSLPSAPTKAAAAKKADDDTVRELERSLAAQDKQRESAQKWLRGNGIALAPGPRKRAR